MTILHCKKNHWSFPQMAQAALKRAGKVRIVGASAGWPPVRDSGDRGIVLDHNNPP